MVVSAMLFAASDVVGGAQEQHRRRERYTDLYLSSDVDTGGGGGVTDSYSVEGDMSECVYPCACASTEPPDCPPGVVAERDGCGCCLVCPRQLGEPCGVSAPCDTHRGLVCRRPHRKPAVLESGVCREASGLPCVVYNRTYEHGETFSLDCRTQCSCQNGTYGCSSLCPQEHISPKGSCSHPRLVDVPGQCCREWMCDSQAAQQPPECQPTFTRWSHCSHNCGAGVSKRRSNLNAACEATLETRLCQVRRCDGLERNPFLRDKHHHVRKGHECKATHRLSQPMRLRFGPCYSRKLFRPKYCGSCSSPGVHCEPLLSTTVKVDFLCEPPPQEIAAAERAHAEENGNSLAAEYLEPGEDMWRENQEELWRKEAVNNWEDAVPDARDPIASNAWQDDGLPLTVSVQWILKCRCSESSLDRKSVV